MNKEAQRIAIAEACGFEQLKSIVEVKRHHKHVWFPKNLPDYLNDLNAMHEAEKNLQSEDQWSEYIRHIANLTIYEHLFAAYSASAAQRAEAFLRTIGKWVE